MKIFLMAWPFWLWGLAYGTTLSSVQEQDPPPATEQRVTDAQFIVIFDYKLNAQDPLLNLRVVTSAKTEHEAIVKATLFLNQKFGATMNFDFLKFVEVGPKKN